LFRSLKINIKLLLILSTTAILAVGIIGYIGYMTAWNAIEEEAFSKLKAVRKIKKNQLIDLFQDFENQLSLVKGMGEIKDAENSFHDLFQEQGADGILSDDWLKHASRYDPLFKKLRTEFGWYDLFLIDAQGNVNYSVMRRADLGTNLRTSDLATSSLAEAYQEIREKSDQEIVFADFKLYSPSSNAPAAFMITPLRGDTSSEASYLAIEIPNHKINHIMHERSGLGKSGETYLVGPDNRMRSESFLDSEGHSVIASFLGNVEENGINTEATQAGLTGKTASKIILDYRGIEVLSAYTFIDLYGKRWALIGEIDKDEALSQVYHFQRKTLYWFVGLIAVIILFAFYFSKTLTRPLKFLTKHTKQLANHDFREGIPKEFSQAFEKLLSRHDEVGDLGNAFWSMQKQLDSSIQTLKATTSAKERMESELNIGKEIQQSMLPLIFPTFPQNPAFDLFAILQPAREVGGDFYDFFFIDEDRFCFCIGDVSDKGVPSALFMAVTKTLIKSKSANDSSTASIITHVNDEMSLDNKSSMFVTLFLCILNTHTGELWFTNAGHNPPLIKRKNGNFEALKNIHGPVVGVLQGISYKEEKTMLKHGDQFLLYTDGVTEARSQDNSLFSEKRLEDLFKASKSNSVKSLTKEIIDDVEDFAVGCPQADDITILAMEYHDSARNLETLYLELTVKNQLVEIDRVNEEFNAFAQHCELPDSVRRKVNLVFDEMLNNIISYAFQDDMEHHIEIRVEFNIDKLGITISDDGIPFNILKIDSPETNLPLEDREIGGLGIHLVRNVMDDYSYRREKEKNISTLIKHLNSKEKT